jgi:hypothetical protein
VVAEGVTLTEVPVTAPTPELMASEVAPVTVQLSVLDWPSVTAAGVALKLAIAGGFPAAEARSGTPATARSATAAMIMISPYRPDSAAL